MNDHRVGKRLQMVIVGLICAGLVSCAGSKTKPAKQAASDQEQVTQSAKLGEEAQVPGTTQIETSKNVAEQRSIPTIEKRSVRADINRMNADDFVALGMDRDAAEKVVRYRQQVGPFQSVDELKKVPGFDVAWYDRVQDRLAAG